MKKTYKNWGDVYSIEFDIVVTKKPTSTMTVFHFTATNHNCCNDGDRIPGFWVNSATFVFRASIGHNYNHAYDGFNFVLGKSYHIAIKQSTDGSKYWFEIIINGNSQSKVENKFGAKTYSTVNLYTGDPWYEPFSSEFGSVCNLKIKQGGTF